MTKIRERLETVVSNFDELEAVLFTSFNFDPEFFENNVLPALLEVDAEGRAARQAAVHQRLAEVAVGVCFDAAVGRVASRDYRYTAYPVSLPGKFFHPKNIMLLGMIGGRRWLYISASSANLTLSGWGRNVECYADVWIHAKSQQPWRELHEFLDWLLSALRLKRPEGHVMKLFRALMNDMQIRRSAKDPELNAFTDIEGYRLYFSPLHNSLWDAVENWHGIPDALCVAVPYWGQVPSNLERFDDIEVELVAARLPMQTFKTGLAAVDAAALDPKRVVLSRWQGEGDNRFRHLKVYQFEYEWGKVLALGSCNFTSAGLGGKHGNVESMLISDVGLSLPEREGLDDHWLAEQVEGEEGAPDHAPLNIQVIYDWKKGAYRWFADTKSLPYKPYLKLAPDVAIDLLNQPSGELLAREGPSPGRFFRVTYWQNDEKQIWKGWIVELNLSYATKVYGPRLAPNDILDSWRGAKDIGTQQAPQSDDADEPKSEEDLKNSIPDKAAQSQRSLNLYDIYRGFHDLERRLHETETLVHELLVSRPDSVFALVQAVDDGPQSTAVRYLVLKEAQHLFSLGSRWQGGAERRAHRREVEARLSSTRAKLLEQIRQELGRDEERAEEMMIWFDNELAAVGRPT